MTRSPADKPRLWPLRLVQFAPLRAIAGKPAVSLLFSPGYIHAAVVARGLPGLQKGRIFQIWARQADRRLVPVGGLSPVSAGAETATIIVASMPIDRYQALSITIESDPAARVPTGAAMFSVKLAAR